MKTKEQYGEIFEIERSKPYPEVDELEKECGFAVDRERLEAAARVLACPLKVNPPSWQHGRVLYALLRRRIADVPDIQGVILDIGTAKGFSATVLGWAIEDSGASGLEVFSVDAVDPRAAVLRNSVAELEKPLTVYEFVEPFLARTVRTSFVGGGSRGMMQELARMQVRIPLAFVDGKHSYEAVTTDAKGILKHQSHGDITVFDDIQIDGVMDGVKTVALHYTMRRIRAGVTRAYMLAERT